MSRSTAKSGQSTLPIESSEASIKTASVSINVLQVGNKQMTMGVFKQLPVEPLIDDVNLLINSDNVWGWVNYLIENTGEKHFIFQRDGKLIRNLFFIQKSNKFTHENLWDSHDCFWKRPPKPYRESINKVKELLSFWIVASFLEGYKPDWTPPFAYHGYAYKYCNNWIRSWKFDKIGRTIANNHLPDEIFAFGHIDEELLPFHVDCQLKARKKLEKWFLDEWVGEIPTSTQIWEHIDLEVERIVVYQKKWDALMERLECCEQLFIAV